MRFHLKDIDGSETVPVVYRGSVPDLFQAGRQVYMRGELQNGVFVAEPDSLVTKCPSKYAPTGS
jgi:cytochrome c-type biogenesis protein CcmE